MTNKEAIDELISLIEHCANMMESKHHEPWESDVQALKIAIGAIKRDSKVDDITFHWNDDKNNFVAACMAFEDILKVYGRGAEEQAIDKLHETGWLQKHDKEMTERPQGKWIEKIERRGCFAGDETVYSYTCPFCGVKEFKKYPFCHCGADMRGK